MLVPWVNELPPWLSYFLVTARNSAYLIDFLIFHETLSPPTEGLPENVRFIGLGEGGLAQLFGLRMGEELAMPVKNASLLIRSIRFMLDKWPRLVAEYKPAFGTIFDKYLGGYSHWGYCDLDMVIGNVPLFVEEVELEGQASLTPILTTCVYFVYTCYAPAHSLFLFFVTPHPFADSTSRTWSPSRSATWTRSTCAGSGRCTGTSAQSRRSGRGVHTSVRSCNESSCSRWRGSAIQASYALGQDQDWGWG